VPPVITLDNQVTFITDPVDPCSGTDFTVTWQEKNAGDEASDDYQDIFDMDDQGTGDSQQLACGGLQPDQAASRSLTFNLPAGDYKMSVVINGQGPISLGNVIINDCD
jgi:hypothetical protein